FLLSPGRLFSFFPRMLESLPFRCIFIRCWRRLTIIRKRPSAQGDCMRNSLRLSLLLSVGVWLVGLSAPAVTQAHEDEPPAAAVPLDPRTSPENLNGADTAWMMVSSALVLMMTAPGLALFYCGLVRKKNVLGVMMQCVFLMGILSIVWALWGYSLAFGEDVLGGLVGNV